MSRQDPGAANGIAAVEPGRCKCGHLAPLHRPERGVLKRCEHRACGCTMYAERPAGVVVRFPGAGTTPAPGRAPITMPDRDAMGERYVAYCEARDSGQAADPLLLGQADLLAHAVAEDCGRWRDEVDRVDALRAELGAEVDRLRDELARLQGGA
ncbi:hypothetical protein ABZ793_06045 [Micromonospora sp. NPDC047465]|uniref:hypothetical protein n=1 Tax=Micromonospora sp. NPDC047465 TaxID=3154813 RepID=UPI0033FE6342